MVAEASHSIPVWQLLNVPVILLVMDGGPGTLGTVLSSMQHKEPVLIISDSGRAASAIHSFCTDAETEIDQACCSYWSLPC